MSTAELEKIDIMGRGWSNRILREVATKIQDGTHFSPRLGGSEYRYITSKNIGPGHLKLGSVEMISEAEHRKIYQRCDVKRGDLLLTKDGANTGNVAISTFSDEISLLSSVAFIRTNHTMALERYILHYFLSRPGRKQIEDAMAGNAITRLTLEKINNLVVPLPSIEEQTETADVLDEVDSLIASTERLIAKKQAIKQGMMQQLLTGKTRLSGFDSPWREARLGDVLRRPPRYGVNAAAVPSSAGAYTYIRITDIDDSGQFTPRPRVGVLHPFAAEYRLQEGDLVFARTGASVGKSYFYDPRDGVLVYAGFLINIAPDPMLLDPRYLALVAQTDSYWDWVARTSVRSGQPGINGREYAQFQFALPDVQEQRAIATAMNGIDGEIRVLNKRLDKARAVKQGMMQELLTGRTRLQPVEAMA